MNIINKGNFTIFSISDSSLTQYSHNDYAVIGFNPDVELKYRKSLTLSGKLVVNESLSYDICVGIVEMDAAEKSQVDSEIEYQNRVNEFHGCAISIKGESKKASTELNDMITRALAQRMPLENKETEVKDQNGKILSLTNTVTVFINMIELTDLQELEKIAGVTIETLDQDSIYTVLSDGSYKYIIPQI